jgi:hypothetical protein
MTRRAPVDDGEASGRREYPDHGPRERTCRGLLAVHDDWQRANGQQHALSHSVRLYRIVAGSNVYTANDE